MIDEQRLQVLRCIDKFDKIGGSGVVELLQKPIDEFGANLTQWRAELIGLFLVDSSESESAENTLENIKNWFSHAQRVTGRLELLAALDKGDEPTLLDVILSCPTTDDETWEIGRRPANMSFVLDDVIAAISGRKFAKSSRATFEKLLSVLTYKAPGG